MPQNQLGLKVIHGVFYWLGVALAVACFVIVWGGHTALLGRFEQSPIPLSWMVGGLAILALAVAEYCDPLLVTPAETAPSRETEPVPEVVHHEVLSHVPH
jgi:hypothetical protein